MIDPAWKKNEYASYRIVNVVRDKISSPYVRASDTDVAKALKVSRATISAYKYGRDAMSAETLGRAQKLAQLSDAELVELMFDMLIEADPKEVGFFIDAKQRVREVMRRALASILLAGLVGVGLGALPAQRVTAATPGDAPQCVYYVKSRRKLLRWLKNKNGLPLAFEWTWARIRSMGSVPRTWSPSPAPT